MSKTIRKTALAVYTTILVYQSEYGVGVQRIIKATEALVDAIGTEGFAQTLSDALQRLAPLITP